VKTSVQSVPFTFHLRLNTTLVSKSFSRIASRPFFEANRPGAGVSGAAP
jgi:hypothetical protein